MEIDELLEYLGIETPGEFEYFDNFADLIEMDEQISSEVIYDLVSEVAPDVIESLITEYFEDLLEHFPGDHPELFTLIESTKMALCGLAKGINNQRMQSAFADELCRFRNWFRFESVALREGRGRRQAVEMPLFDALVLYRADQLDPVEADRYEYDFQGCLDYTPDEYMVPISEYMEDMEDMEDVEDM